MQQKKRRFQTAMILVMAGWVLGITQVVGSPAISCVNCHGQGGSGYTDSGASAIGPKLAGQVPAYMVKQLKSYAQPKQDSLRYDPVMSAIAQQLTPEMILNFGAMYQNNPITPEPIRVSEDVLARGKHIWQQGSAEDSVPACMACHGPAGKGIGPLFPRLAGQKQNYLEAQMRAFRDKVRRNGPMMVDIAGRMTEEDIVAVSAYAASLSSRDDLVAK